MRDRGDDQDDDQRGEQPVEEEREERQPEDVEADVLVELRVLDPERLRVGEEDPLLPLAGDAAAGDQREERGDRDADPAAVRADRLLVPGEQLVLGPHRAGCAGARRSATVRLTSISTKKRTVKTAVGANRAQSRPRQVVPKPTESNQR